MRIFADISCFGEVHCVEDAARGRDSVNARLTRSSPCPEGTKGLLGTGHSTKGSARRSSSPSSRQQLTCPIFPYRYRTQKLGNMSPSHRLELSSIPHEPQNSISVFARPFAATVWPAIGDAQIRPGVWASRRRAEVEALATDCEKA